MKERSADSREKMVMSDESELVKLRTTRHANIEEIIQETFRFFQENDTGYVWESICDEMRSTINHYAVKY